jgi:signal transduction histidine kinase
MIQVKPGEARVLIVEDMVANIALLTNMLGRIGYHQLRSITDPRETVAELERFKPDLIILDLMMPYLDGFQVMQQLKGVIPEESYLPILVLTADMSPVSKRKALASGASDFLLKPFDASEIFMRIRNLLQTRFLYLAIQDQNLQLEQKVTERTAELSAALEQIKETQRLMLQQERLRAFGEMAGGVVHDFNNALMSVIGYSELILQDPALLEDKPAVLSYLKTMNTAGRDAAHVVGRLREFYRPRDAADLFESVNLNKIIEEAVALTQPKWRDQALADGRTIEISLELEKIPAIAGNAAELREILTNLIFNSVDAMPNGGAITARTSRANNRVVFELTDTGTGMTDEVRTRCLEPFFSTKGDKGTGLGLSMVFGVIRRHEGQLEIESASGRGSTFRISFPRQVKTFETVTDTEPGLQRSLRVLVVDDEAVPRDVVSKYLCANGHEVIAVTDGADALENFRQRAFDLVITDQAMPQMTGTQLAELIKAERPGQPVLMLTGYSDPTLPRDTIPAMVDYLLPKPISQQDLRSAIAKLVPT